MPADGAAMKTADPELMRAINRFIVMDAIRRFGTDLACRDLGADGAQPDHRLGDHGGPPRGRPDRSAPGRSCPRPSCAAGRASCSSSIPGRPRSAARSSLPNQITIAVTNFQADVLGTRVDPDQGRSATCHGHPGSRGGRRSAPASRRRASQVENISGLCLGVPGIVERASGICRYSPLFSRARSQARPRPPGAARMCRRRSTATST